MGQRITVSGMVFLADDAKTPLPGVQVSDGDQIVQTDQTGRYALDLVVDAPRHVVVTVPTGYRPSGPFYRRIAATRVYDFGLIEDRGSRESSFEFLVGADFQHLGSAETNHSQLSDDFAELARLGRHAAFAVFAGDLTGSGQRDDLMSLKEAADRIWNKPVHVAFGAHDLLNPTGIGNFMGVFGPYYYAADYGGSHFLFLTSERDHIAGPRFDRQMRWLERDLALQPDDKPIYLVCHTPEDIAEHIERIARTTSEPSSVGIFTSTAATKAPAGFP